MNLEYRCNQELASITPDDIPADILELILRMIATDIDDDPEDRCKGVVAASQVCRAWRSTALGAPYLWAKIIDFQRHPFSWIKELIRRSAPAPLEFGRVDSPVYTYRKNVASILDHLLKGRIRGINIIVDLKTWQCFTLHFCSELPLHLEYLRLHILAGSWTLPTLAARRQTSSLRCLYLTSICTDVTTEVSFPNLEELSLESCQGPLTPPDMLRFLEKTPNLRYLALVQSIDAETKTYKDLISVSLDHLELLFINDPTDICLSLMEKLQIPTRCGLMLDLIEVETDHEMELRYLVESRLRSWEGDITGRSLYARHAPGHAYLSFGNVFVGILWAYQYIARTIFAERHASPDPPLMIRIAKSCRSDTFTPLFVSFFSLFQPTYSTLTFLELWIDPMTEPEAGDAEQELVHLAPDLGQMIGLQTLEILDISCHFLFPMLQQTSPMPDSVHLPSLRMLRFLPVSFGPPPRHRPSHAAELADICAFLRWRTARGFGVPNIDLCNCFSEQEIEDAGIRNLADVVYSLVD